MDVRNMFYKRSKGYESSDRYPTNRHPDGKNKLNDMSLGAQASSLLEQSYALLQAAPFKARPRLVIVFYHERLLSVLIFNATFFTSTSEACQSCRYSAYRPGFPRDRSLTRVDAQAGWKPALPVIIERISFYDRYLWSLTK